MRLMQFPQALEAVLETLERMRDERAHRPCASRSALDALNQAAPARSSGNLRETKIDPPSPSLRRAGSDKIEQLASVQSRVCACTKCPNLARTRTQTVFGVGNPDAEIMFIGEAPGADEDAQGEPFVGRAGQLLTRIIVAMGLTRETVYIANILKCRPDTPGQSAGNRKPAPEEMATCIPYLQQQIDLIKPKVIVALGGTALEGLIGKNLGITKLRGQWQIYRNLPLMPTFHPSYLLRPENESQKRN